MLAIAAASQRLNVSVSRANLAAALVRKHKMHLELYENGKPRAAAD